MAKIEILQRDVNERVALAQAGVQGAVAAIPSDSPWRRKRRLGASLQTYPATQCDRWSSARGKASVLGRSDTAGKVALVPKVLLVESQVIGLAA